MLLRDLRGAATAHSAAARGFFFALLVAVCGGFQPAALRCCRPAPGYAHGLSLRRSTASPRAASPRDARVGTVMVAAQRAPGAERGSDERQRPPEALADTVYNFAFGSNLNAEKRQSRGVNGTGIVSRSVLPAVVKGFRLAFNLPMFPPVEPGMAALAKAREGEDDSCHGLLLELTNEEYQKMWASEGGLAQRPPYEETVVEATTYDGRYVVRLLYVCTAQQRRTDACTCTARFAPSPSRQHRTRVPTTSCRPPLATRISCSKERAPPVHQHRGREAGSGAVSPARARIPEPCPRACSPQG